MTFPTSAHMHRLTLVPGAGLVHLALRTLPMTSSILFRHLRTCPGKTLFLLGVPISHHLPPELVSIETQHSSPRECYSCISSFHGVFPRTKTRLERFSKGWGPPGLSRTVPVLLSQSASPAWSHMTAAGNSCTASSWESHKRMPPFGSSSE